MVSPEKTLSLPQFHVQDHGKWSSWASLVAQAVKKLPAVQEIQARSLDREDPLEKILVLSLFSYHHLQVYQWQVNFHKVVFES